MTKAELEKESEEYLKKKNYTSGHIGYFASCYCKQTYIDCAEPREKQLNKAKEIIRALLKHTYGQNLNTQNDFDLYLGRIKEAEQFLKETN